MTTLKDLKAKALIEIELLGEPEAGRLRIYIKGLEDAEDVVRKGIDSFAYWEEDGTKQNLIKLKSEILGDEPKEGHLK